MTVQKSARSRRTRGPRSRHPSLAITPAELSTKPSPLRKRQVEGPVGERHVDIWLHPPTSLPGPFDHPFFDNFTEVPKSGVTSSTARLQSGLEPPSEGSSLSDKLVPNTKDQDQFASLPVYPFIHPPTIRMATPDPTASDKTCPTSSLSQTQESSPPGIHISTQPPQSPPALLNAGLSSDASPCVQATAPPSPAAISTIGAALPLTSASQPRRPIAVAEASQSANQSTQRAATTISSQAPLYALYYSRSILNTVVKREVLLHGQIWRSGDKKSGWRRNQWVVEIG